MLMWLCGADGEEVGHCGRVFGGASEVEGEEVYVGCGCNSDGGEGCVEGDGGGHEGG